MAGSRITAELSDDSLEINQDCLGSNEALRSELTRLHAVIQRKAMKGEQEDTLRHQLIHSLGNMVLDSSQTDERKKELLYTAQKHTIFQHRHTSTSLAERAVNAGGALFGVNTTLFKPRSQGMLKTYIDRVGHQPPSSALHSS